MLVVLLAFAIIIVVSFAVRVTVIARRRARAADNAYLVMRAAENSTDLACGFIDLMRAGAVSIHTITNKGESYCDSRQKELFQASLTPDHMEALFSIRGQVR